ncbi:signal peptide peptidase SppA [Maribacter sp. 2-571]|uniref:signal peptide peptidase SppA n=1 Tax=Maribacter sp. 2-571 TaxID=3417569 RepID=UPI003D342E75
MKFLRNLLAAILGTLIALGIVFLMFFILASLIGNAEDTVSIESDSILELQLQLPINDYTGQNNTDPFAGVFEQSQGLDEILNAIQVAKDDNDIKGISINNNFLLTGLAQTQEIRKALADFKESGKFVYAYGDFYLQKDYYLATVADSIFLNPVGGMDFKGLSSEVLFFKELQEKTGVKLEVIRHGKYKSAVEPFIADEMSDANRRQIKELIMSLWESMVVDMAAGRNTSVANLNAIADTLGGRLPQYAKNSGLVDGLLFYDQYEKKLRNAVSVAEDGELNVVSLEEYTKRANTKGNKKGKDKIAVIYAQGEIRYGEGDQEGIGQGLMTKAIRKVKDDEDVKAIVLRVDSPGGSALVSDIIWRELELAKAKKPVVVSMGNVAASGGYYIAVGANKIFAEPTTITGSIGVFGTVPNINGLATDIGINAEQVGTHKNAVDYSVFEPMDDTFRETVQEGIEEIYDTFLDRVSQGRGISIAEADSLAQGRVWSGTDAKRLGLIDELGNLDDAITEAAKMAELESYGIRKYPKYKTGFEQLMEDLGGAGAKAQEKFIKEKIGTEAYQTLRTIKTALQQKGIQARMPFVLDID